jgi:hypothetical protein
MNLRKIAVIGSFAAGAALSFAPLASADDLTTTIDSEISSLNSTFASEVGLAGDSKDLVTATAPGFDTIPLADAPQTAPFTTLDYELYGLNPALAGPAGDPGSYNVFNGALVEFDDAYNALLYSADYNGALIPASDLFGSASEITTALATGSDLGAAGDFFSAGLADLTGFFGI